MDFKTSHQFFILFAATTLILMSGTLYLIVLKVGFSEALTIGFYPFLIGDVVKSTISAAVIYGVRKL